MSDFKVGDRVVITSTSDIDDETNRPYFNVGDHATLTDYCCDWYAKFDNGREWCLQEGLTEFDIASDENNRIEELEQKAAAFDSIRDHFEQLKDRDEAEAMSVGFGVSMLIESFYQKAMESDGDV